MTGSKYSWDERWWWGSLALLVGAILLTLALLIATLSGVADPHPLGKLRIDDQFEHPDVWEIVSPSNTEQGVPQQTGSYTIRVTAGGPDVFVKSPHVVRAPCTLEISVRQASGGGDIHYGLWWGSAIPDSRIAMGVSSNGYVGIVRGDLHTGTPRRDWERFPHVRSIGTINRLRVDITGDSFVARLNDEVVGEFKSRALYDSIMVGVFAQPSTISGGEVIFVRMQVWTP